uniref:Uncharacterized protein n=1 Tax=Rhizophora mucronata TaxID=61149 RepID=A0A2P2Q1H9_RHIMU
MLKLHFELVDNLQKLALFELPNDIFFSHCGKLMVCE